MSLQLNGYLRYIFDSFAILHIPYDRVDVSNRTRNSQSGVQILIPNLGTVEIAEAKLDFPDIIGNCILIDPVHVPSMSRSDILYVIDHCWMVEDPALDEYAFLFRWIQERHRERFDQVFQNPDQYDSIEHYLKEIEQQRDRAEEILYWLYLDSELRSQGNTVPDLWENQCRGLER
jgi:hypothetical protein